jgi:RNA polymerase sigma factor (sigma-70 family)
MPDVSDMELLRDYGRRGSEEAFAILVQRHVNLVYSVALRHVGIAAQAEEITQAVFVILARKAASLRPDSILEGWLHATTRLTALSFMRGERRRQFREQEAYMQSTLQESTDASAWNQLAPLLDEAVSRLGEKDRDAVMLRFFKEKSLREVAAALRVNEPAAQRRVLRAVEKLRGFFTKRGVVLPAAVLTAAISANSVQAAPIGLATAVVATAAKGSAAAASTLTLVKGALKIMAWTKAKTAIVTSVAVIFTAAIVTPTVTHYYHRSNSQPSRPNFVGTFSTSENPKTADEATRAIFEAWGRGDWNTFAAFWEPGAPPVDSLFNDEIKRSLAGLEIVSLGKPTNSFGPNMWFVPYKIRFSNGQVKEFRLHVAQDPKTKRWYFKGGF